VEGRRREAGTITDAAPLRPGELERSCLSPAEARRKLGWQAEIALLEGLERTYHALTAGFAAEAA